VRAKGGVLGVGKIIVVDVEEKIRRRRRWVGGGVKYPAISTNENALTLLGSVFLVS
jgi:hypothetical protein